MSVLQAIRRGFPLSFRLWFTWIPFILAYATVSYLAVQWLPFQVAEGRIAAAPLPDDPQERAALAVRALGLWVLALGLGLWLLGGVLDSLRRLQNGQPVSLGEFLQGAGRNFFRMAGWGIAFFAVLLGVAMGIAFLLTFLWAVTGRSEGAKGLVGTGFYAAGLATGLLLVFSPVSLAEGGRGILASLRDSYRFVRRRGLGTIGLALGLGLVGAVVWWLWVLCVAPPVGALRSALGLAPYSTGPEVFFFALILLLPQAFLSVYIPAVLHSYFHGNR